MNKKSSIWAIVLAILASYPLLTQAQRLPNNISTELRELLEYVSQVNEPDSATFVDAADRAMEMAKKENSDSAYSRALYYKISYISYKFSPVDALPLLKDFRDYTESTGKGEIALYDAWNNVIIQYMNSGDMVNALAETNKMLVYSGDNKSNYGKGTAYSILGTAYENNYDTAMQNFNRALDFMHRGRYADDISYVYMLMARTAMLNKRYDEALEYTAKLRELDTTEADTQMADIIDLHCYVDLNRRDDAKTVHDRLKKLWDDYKISGIYENSFISGMTNYECKYGNPDNALALLKYIPKENEEARLYTQLRCYLTRGDYRRAYEAQARLSEIQKESIAQMQDMELANAAAIYNTRLLEEEKQNLERNHARTRNILLIVAIVALALLLAGAIYLIMANRRNSKRMMLECYNTEQQRKLAEEALRRAESSEDMKSVFINSMCHEMRTPMNAISGFADLMFDEKYPVEQRAKYARILRDNVESLTHLLENMLDMSHLITMNEKMDKTMVDMTKVCQKAIEETKRYNVKGLDIRMDVERNLKVLTNANYTEKIIKELLVNAIKFTDKGRVALCCFTDIVNRRVVLTVTDTGIGVPADKQEWIFEQYSKVDSFKPGVGIGLYVCREICNHLGMRIHVDASHSGGCRMVVEFPLS